MSWVKKEEQYDDEDDEIQVVAVYKVEKPWLTMKLDCCKNESCITSYYYKDENTRYKPVVASTSKNMKNEEETIDGDSIVQANFEWATFGNVHIPCILRPEDKYCAVRMLESNLLKYYLEFLHHDIIYKCTSIRSYYITVSESKLLNEINVRHCDYQFGRQTFTTEDLIIRLSDAEEFYNFLSMCHYKLKNGSQNVTDRCGFLTVNKQELVPYTMHKSKIFLPLFYFEGDIDRLKLQAEKLEGWNLSYLKFCCKVQGIQSALYAADSCSAISLNDIKRIFPPETSFQKDWPKKTYASQQLIYETAQTQRVQWTIINPDVAPSMSPRPPTSSKPATQAKNSTELQNIHQAMAPPHTNAQTIDTAQRTATPANYTISALVESSGASSRAQPMTLPPPPQYQPPFNPVRLLERDLRFNAQQGQRMEAVAPGVAASHRNAQAAATAQRSATPANYTIPALVQSAAASSRAQPMTLPPPPQYQPPLNPVRLLERDLSFYGPQQGQRMEAIAPGVAASVTNAQTTATAQRTATPANFMMPALVQSSGAPYGARQQLPMYPPPLNTVQQLEEYLRFHEPKHVQKMEPLSLDGEAASHTNAQSRPTAQRTTTPANYMMPALVQSSGAPYGARQVIPQQPMFPPPLNAVQQLEEYLRFHGPRQGQRMEALSLDGVAASHTNAQTTAAAQRTATPANYMMPPLVQSSSASHGAHPMIPQPIIPQQPRYQPPLNPVPPLEQGRNLLHGPQHGQGMEVANVGVAASHTNARTRPTAQRKPARANYMVPPLVQLSGAPYRAQEVTPQQPMYPPPRTPVGQLQPDGSRNRRGQRTGAVDPGVAASHTNAQTTATAQTTPALVQSGAPRSGQKTPQQPNYDELPLNLARPSKRDFPFHGPHPQQGQGMQVVHPGVMSQHPPAMINQQPAHQQLSSNQPSTSANGTHGSMPTNSPLKPLPDPPTSGSHIPYQLKMALLQGKVIPCINMKPYVFTEVLVTLRDLVAIFFNNIPVQLCQQVMSVLGIELYRGNNSQMRVLLQNGRCESLNEVVPLVQLQSVVDYMPQLKYMIGGILEAMEKEQMAKRQRTN